MPPNDTHYGISPFPKSLPWQCLLCGGAYTGSRVVQRSVAMTPRWFWRWAITYRISKGAILLNFFLYVFLICPSLASAGQDTTTIVSFTRHTFRGVAEEISQQKIVLKDYGIDLEIPLFSYAQDATPHGLAIAKKFGSEGALHKAANLAVQSLSGHKSFDGRWDTFRADLSTQRTFWTAIKVREGIEGRMRHPVPIALTGCKTTPNQAIDIVSTRPHSQSCVPSSVPDVELLRLLKTRSEKFLAQFRTAIGIDNTMPSLPSPYYSDGQILPKEYEEVAKLANFIEMAAALTQPKDELLKKSTKADQGRVLKQGKGVVTDALNMLGIRFFIKNPQLVADSINVQTLKYMASRPKGSHTAIFTHDDYISSLLRSLGFITEKSDASKLAIYPLETVVFAFDNKEIAVTRMRLEVQENGDIPGDKFQISQVWKGSIEAWNEKVQEVIERAGPPCLITVNICEAETLEVVY